MKHPTSRWGASFSLRHLRHAWGGGEGVNSGGNDQTMLDSSLITGWTIPVTATH